MSASTLSRRQFMARTTMAAAAACLSHPLMSLAEMKTAPGPGLSLGGEWQVAKAGTDEWIPARVPGCIHTDLLAAGKIPDPFYRENEKDVQWVGETDWVYRRTFEVPAETLNHDLVVLRCEGLDTFATIKINDQAIGTTNNMFRIWEFDVKPVLKAGENKIEVALNSVVPFINERQKERDQHHGVGGRSWVRKEPCSFGWDWAPILITSGIWRTISIQTADEARLKNLVFSQDHSIPGQVGLSISVAAQVFQNAPIYAEISIGHDGKSMATKRIALTNAHASETLILKNPELWWPNGMGGQPLYTVSVNLLNQNSKTVDSTTRRIGLRTLKLVEKTEQSPLHFVANGIPFFAKGANWIPSDSFAPRVTPERLHQYVADAAAVNMNMLRCWGGGYYEEDALYDACDERGICIWIDFKFACASYPSFDDDFMNNVRGEARDNLGRLAHHPCIAAWCGNNEITYLVRDTWGPNCMSREGYDRLFKNLLGQQVQELSPDSSYVSGSPDCGDVHYWDVWWGDKTFDSYRNLSGFMSEFGFQSYPEPKSVRAYTVEADRNSTFSDVMKWHERALTGNQRIQSMTGNYFKMPRDFDNTLWVSQLVQGYGIKMGAEAWRRDRPKSMGCLFWQYNDCWPVASWASVDYYGRWKALHYLARHFYAPLLVSGLEHREDQTVDIFISSDELKDHEGIVSWNVTDFDGRSLKKGSQKVQMAKCASQKVQTLDLAQECQRAGAQNILVWLKLHAQGKTVSENLVTLVRPKELNVPNPHIKSALSETSDGFKVTLTSDKPALWAWLSMDEQDAGYSDNFVHLAPHTPMEILVQPRQPISKADLGTYLNVKNLFDLSEAAT